MFKGFIEDSKGNVAIIFAMVAMMLFAVVGIAVDFSSAQSKRSNLQSLADAAVLASVSSGEKDNLAKLTKYAKKSVVANNTSGDIVTVKVKITKDGNLQVTTKNNYKTYLMRMFGRPVIKVKALAEAPLSSVEAANIVLVLDTTGSMGGTKLQTLKSAAKELVKTLSEFDDDSVRISVIPFAEYVNVGLSRRHAVWLNVGADTSKSNGDTCTYPVIGKKNCKMKTYPATPAKPAVAPSTCYNDGMPYSCGGSSYVPAKPAGVSEVCENIYSTTQTCTPNAPSVSKWNGCVGSRKKPHNERANYNSKKIPGLLDPTSGVTIKCGAEILPLTKNYDAVNKTIDSLTADGETYLPGGLIWGWRALKPTMPLTQASGNKKARKIMILMTDGDNTKSVNGSLHNGTNENAANQLTKKLCTKINGDDIELYTVAYEVKNITTKKMIKKCATKPSNYFDAKNANDLKAAFKAIGRSLQNLRLTH